MIALLCANTVKQVEAGCHKVPESLSHPYKCQVVSEKTEVGTGPRPVIKSALANCGVSGGQVGSSNKVLPFPSQPERCQERTEILPPDIVSHPSPMQSGEGDSGNSAFPAARTQDT